MFWWQEEEGLFSAKSTYCLGMLGHIDSWVDMHGPGGDKYGEEFEALMDHPNNFILHGGL